RDSRRRRHAARSCDDPLRGGDERRQLARAEQSAGARRWRWRASSDRNSCACAARHADRELARHPARTPWRQARSLREQHWPFDGAISVIRRRVWIVALALLAGQLSPTAPATAASGGDLLAAAKRGDRERVRALIKGGADVTSSQPDGTTAL